MLCSKGSTCTHKPVAVSFDVWIRQLDDRGVLNAERFFEGRVSLYGAMPACWKHLNMDKRQEVMNVISSIYNDVLPNEKVWTKVNVLRLTKFVKLDDVFKLRACYLTAKADPSVITRVEEESIDSNCVATASARIESFC